MDKWTSNFSSCVLRHVWESIGANSLYSDLISIMRGERRGRYGMHMCLLWKYIYQYSFSRFRWR